MNKGILDQRCQVMQQASVSDQWNPDTETLAVLIDNVPCALDTLMMSAVSKMVSTGTTLLTGGGLVFIDGDYGEGSTRLFDEKNVIRVSGFDFYIKAIHDVHGGYALDHYEIECERRVQGGVPNAR